MGERERLARRDSKSKDIEIHLLLELIKGLIMTQCTNAASRCPIAVP